MNYKEIQWIPVSNELPQQKEESQGIYDPDTLAEIDRRYYMASDLVIVYVQDKEGESFVADDILVDNNWVNFPYPEWEVTYWMPLPPPPKIN
jgi:hypothetical protein